MSRILYANSISNFASKVRVALELKGLAYEERLPPDGYGTPAYKRIVPMGTIPALVEDDFVLSESETILEYLEPPLRAMFSQLNQKGRRPDLVADQCARFARRLEQLEVMADASGPFIAGALSTADCGYPATIALAQVMLPLLGSAYLPGRVMAAWEAAAEAHPVLGRHKQRYRAEAEAWAARKMAD